MSMDTAQLNRSRYIQEARKPRTQDVALLKPPQEGLLRLSFVQLPLESWSSGVMEV